MMFLYLLHLVFFFGESILIDFNVLLKRFKLALLAHDLFLSAICGGLQLGILLVQLVKLSFEFFEVSTRILE